MVEERFAQGVIYFWGWRCLNCGEIIDPLIEKNRKAPPLPDREEEKPRRGPKPGKPQPRRYNESTFRTKAALERFREDGGLY